MLSRPAEMSISMFLTRGLLTMDKLVLSFCLKLNKAHTSRWWYLNVNPVKNGLVGNDPSGNRRFKQP